MHRRDEDIPLDGGRDGESIISRLPKRKADSTCIELKNLFENLSA